MLVHRIRSGPKGLVKRSRSTYGNSKPGTTIKVTIINIQWECSPYLILQSKYQRDVHHWMCRTQNKSLH